MQLSFYFSKDPNKVFFQSSTFDESVVIMYPTAVWPVSAQMLIDNSCVLAFNISLPVVYISFNQYFNEKAKVEPLLRNALNKQR